MDCLTMEGRRRVIVYAALGLMFWVALLPEVDAVRYIVGGGSIGWTSGFVNYTVWAQGIHFYNGDWLFFVYDRTQKNVLEVNETNYQTCNADHPLHNWTAGAGRDVVPLNVTKTYYFISGNGFCYGGMKVAINVENPPPPPPPPPLPPPPPPPVNEAPRSFRTGIMLPALFGVAAAWEWLLLIV